MSDKNVDIKKLLGKKIKKLRIKKDLTQEQLAERINVSQRTLSGIECGNNFLTAETLERLTESLDVTVDELFLVEHLRSSQELVEEMIHDIKSVKGDPEKVESLYKVVKALIKE